MTKWKLNFEIDFRAVRLFRLLLGATIALDMLQRIAIAEVFYSDDGLLPRALITSKAAAFAHWASPFFISGSALWSQTIFAVMLVLALALAAGCKVRVTSFLLFFLTAGMHVRAPIIVYGADTITRVMLFWSIFLPIRPPSADYKISNAVSASVLIQLALVYIFAGWLKSADAYWYRSTAVYHALALNIYGSSIGHFILGFPMLSSLASQATLIIERFGWILFFIPWKKDLVRLCAFAIFAAMHFGFYLCINVGLFPLLDVVFLTLLLPGSVFPERLFRGWDTEPAGKAVRILAPIFVSLFLCVNFLGRPESRLDWKSSAWSALRAIGLDQGWNFFAPYPPSQEAEWTISGRDTRGSTVDLTKSIFPTGLLGHMARTKYKESLMNSSQGGVLKSLARHACQGWNRRHPEAPLVDINILLTVRTIPDAPSAPYFHFMPVATAAFSQNPSTCNLSHFRLVDSEITLSKDSWYESAVRQLTRKTETR